MVISYIETTLDEVLELLKTTNVVLLHLANEASEVGLNVKYFVAVYL